MRRGVLEPGRWLGRLEGGPGRFLRAKASPDRALRDELLAASQRATRRLNESCGAGKEAAIALRSFVKSKLGYRNEELVRFGIAPQRRRRGRRRGKAQVM